MKVRAYMAECVGTFLLAFLVRLALGSQLPVATPIIAALTLGLIVYALGPVSGAHVNPAVTLGLLSIGKIKTRDAFWYIVAQLVGAFLAGLAAAPLVGTALSLNPTDLPITGIAEAVGAAIFLFGVSSVVWKKAPENMSGVTIGTSLLLGILAAATVGNGVVNPAVALAIGSLSLSYLVGPIVGAIAGVWIYRYVTK